MKRDMKKRKAKVWLTTMLAAFFILALPAVGFAADWSPDTAKSKIMEFVGILVVVVAVFLATKEYGKGRKGRAIAEVIAGALIYIFVTSDSPFKSMSGFIKGLLGL
ncbi:TcpD family membrane protein [Aneurinibacillus aneurinilyticus]|uniref:TcpD family membrane protein n=1 Tax=Aneurinibacillus aneurinilyticus TaxID=1391 RepID=UPI002E1B4B1C|nr:TcpD family membrane protein [Aneurinibacillus aneurinilyticus]MED0722214.1 TcpD family membrane protein [Aneurinibacillus aneurinilyticus]